MDEDAVLLLQLDEIEDWLIGFEGFIDKRLDPFVVRYLIPELNRLRKILELEPRTIPPLDNTVVWI